MEKRVIFVFPMLPDGSVLLHRDEDAGRHTCGQYIPPHKKTLLDSDFTDSELGYDVLNRYGITGRIRDASSHVLPYERGEFHYLAADVGTYHSSGELESFTEDQVIGYRSNDIANWVPEIMRAMGLLP